MEANPPQTEIRHNLDKGTALILLKIDILKYFQSENLVYKGVLISIRHQNSERRPEENGGVLLVFVWLSNFFEEKIQK